jgi:hypothetical protein
MVRPGRDLLTGRVEVDETYLGGLEEGLRGRLVEKKALIVIAAQRGWDRRGVRGFFSGDRRYPGCRGEEAAAPRVDSYANARSRPTGSRTPPPTRRAVVAGIQAEVLVWSPRASLVLIRWRSGRGHPLPRSERAHKFSPSSAHSRRVSSISTDLSRLARAQATHRRLRVSARPVKQGRNRASSLNSRPRTSDRPRHETLWLISYCQNHTGPSARSAYLR